MFDFFDTLRSFYSGGKFCDVEIVSYVFDNDDVAFAVDRVRCHSLVLCSAVPSILQVVDTNKAGDDPETVIIVAGLAQAELGKVSVKETVDSIYDCFAGIADPDPVSW